MNSLATIALLGFVAAAQAYKIPPVVTNFDVLDKDSSGHVDRTEVDKHLDAQFDVSRLAARSARVTNIGGRWLSVGAPPPWCRARPGLVPRAVALRGRWVE